MLADPASTESGIQETETVPDLNGTKKESDKFFSNSSDSFRKHIDSLSDYFHMLDKAVIDNRIGR